MMSATVLSRETAEAALLGGAVLGGGGGGSLQKGRINAEAALRSLSGLTAKSLVQG